MNENTENEIEQDCEEHSFCNCENSETITPYLRDDCDCFDEAAEAVADKCHEAREDCDCRDGAAETVADKCHELRAACEEKVEKLARKWEQCNKNPYFKHTCTVQTDIYRSPRDETPIDTVKLEHGWACSLRTLAIIGGTVLAVILTKKMFGKKC